jgi:hypothetical protein
MDLRPFLRPLPLTLVLLFAAVAVGDLVRSLVEKPSSQPETAATPPPRFEALEPVIDFRAGRGGAGTSVELQPVPRLDPDQWYGAEQQGVWAASETADMTFNLGTGGHRLLVLECLPARGQFSVRAVKLRVNDTDCGTVSLAPEWGRYRVELPDGSLRSGPNRISLRFESEPQASETRRMLLIRKLGLFFDTEARGQVEVHARPLVLGADAERIRIRTAGTLEVPLKLDDRCDALQFRYRFMSGAGRAEVAVLQMGRGSGTSAGVDVGLKASINADHKDRGRIRIPLHGRRGAYSLRIRAVLAPGDAPLLLSSLRLVEEGDPSRRLWTANPLRRQSSEAPPREE